jgi:tetrahydromethanopterin S-methyltransferase subunit G
LTLSSWSKKLNESQKQKLKKRKEEIEKTNPKIKDYPNKKRDVDDQIQKWRDLLKIKQNKEKKQFWELLIPTQDDKKEELFWGVFRINCLTYFYCIHVILTSYMDLLEMKNINNPYIKYLQNLFYEKDQNLSYLQKLFYGDQTPRHNWNYLQESLKSITRNLPPFHFPPKILENFSSKPITKSIKSQILYPFQYILIEQRVLPFAVVSGLTTFAAKKYYQRFRKKILQKYPERQKLIDKMETVLAVELLSLKNLKLLNKLLSSKKIDKDEYNELKKQINEIYTRVSLEITEYVPTALDWYLGIHFYIIFIHILLMWLKHFYKQGKDLTQQQLYNIKVLKDQATDWTDYRTWIGGLGILGAGFVMTQTGLTTYIGVFKDIIIQILSSLIPTLFSTGKYQFKQVIKIISPFYLIPIFARMFAWIRYQFSDFYLSLTSTKTVKKGKRGKRGKIENKEQFVQQVSHHVVEEITKTKLIT